VFDMNEGDDPLSPEEDAVTGEASTVVTATTTQQPAN
jgi:hypothetical protein